MLHIQYEKHEMQDYLVPSNISQEVAKFTFLCRTRMLPVGANFKQGGKTKNPFCPVCKIVTEYDSQTHLMWCKKLNVNLVANQKIPQYDDLFNKSLKRKISVVQLLRKNLQKRNNIINQT